MEPPFNNTDPNSRNYSSNQLPNVNSPAFSNRWRLIKEKLKEIVDQENYTIWIEPLNAKEISDTEIVILLPNVIFYQGILDHYLDKIEQAKNILGIDQLLIRFEIEGSSPIEEETKEPIKAYSDSVADSADIESERIAGTQQSSLSRSLSNKSNLNPNYDFGSFVRGDSNQFAHATCLAVADAPGKTYNPLFIYGCTGLGKTHLLHAVGLKILERSPGAVIIYISSERFMNEMIYCIRFNKMWDFRRKYRNCDVFLVDDIQFISGKERTQEEFFHTFNTLYEAKKQIVITSDLFPQDIPDIEDRLRNRFQWGLIADIQPPSVEHRVAILMNKADNLGFHLRDDVAMYIANHIKKNVRELEGALHRIAAFSALHGRQIDLELAQETFQNVLGEAPKRLTVEMIQKTVADHFKIRIADLKSKKRQRALTVPRQIAMYLSRVRTPASFPEIGGKFGGKDHTTVMHAVRKIEFDRTNDLDLKTSIEALERKLEQQY
jgi:chromosomal replication initiator protein